MPRRKLDKPNFRLRRRDESGAWYIDWTDPETGRTRSVSTRQTERKQAEVWRDQWIAGREQPIPPSQATIAEIMRAYTEARLPHVEAKKQMLQFAKTIVRSSREFRAENAALELSTARHVPEMRSGLVQFAAKLVSFVRPWHGQSVSNGLTVRPTSRCRQRHRRATDG